MTAHGAPVVWLRQARDTTYRSSAKNRCADCRVEIQLSRKRCLPCSRHHRQNERKP